MEKINWALIWLICYIGGGLVYVMLEDFGFLKPGLFWARPGRWIKIGDGRRQLRSWIQKLIKITFFLLVVVPVILAIIFNRK